MSKPDADSDLYGDIYSDDLNEFDAPEDSDSPNGLTTEPPDTPNIDDTPASTQHTGKVNESHSVSYSAQIAQQFSAYKQTPSQERQPKANPPQPIPRHASVSDAPTTIFGKKPSEMHDSG
ncbi:hypothetical protein D9611_000910 [Ephemerocybe angulata]|uniref:Uncharacterized protein n=1 Tax=Ephemerocybe angulata TaxID=980116 RepID=A0A8H5F6X9_9AGAR|nr:hypothetical protein D9611_000910 [Tulosesus angulatus]